MIAAGLGGFRFHGRLVLLPLMKIKIKPDCLGAYAKKVKDPTRLGRVMFALMGREGELNPPLHDYEQDVVEMLYQQYLWYEEAKTREAERKRGYKEAKVKASKDGTPQEKEDSAEIRGNPRIPRKSSEIQGNPDPDGISSHPSIHPSVHPSIRSTKESPPLTPPQGGDGEGGEAKVRYSVEKIRKEALAAFLSPKDVDAFAEYVFSEALLEKDGYERIGALRQYLKAIYRTWKSKGLDNPELHQLTDAELDTAVVAVNEARKGVKIDDDTKDAFWNWLVGEGFKNSKGEMVTAYNVSKLLTWWLANVYHFEEKAAERKKQEESKPKSLYPWDYQPSSLRMEDEL